MNAGINPASTPTPALKANASIFDVFIQGPTDAAPVKVGNGVPGPTFEKSGLAAGNYSVSVVGTNSKGNGPTSEVVGIVVG